MPRNKYNEILSKAILSRQFSKDGKLAFINESSRLLDTSSNHSSTGNDNNGKDESSAPTATDGSQTSSRVAQHLLQRWFPSKIEQDDRFVLNWDQYSLQQSSSTSSEDSKKGTTIRTTRRRIFLFLTEPSTSLGSAIFFTIVMVMIFLSNIVMILQTMKPWQFIPTDCVSCGG